MSLTQNEVSQVFVQTSTFTCLKKPQKPPSSTISNSFVTSPANLDRELMIGSIDKKQLNTIFWSPKGRFLAFANLGRGITQFDFEIYDCDYEGENKEMNKELNSNVMAINIGESYGTTDVEWDPTGRFIATSSSFWKHTVPTPPRTPLIISWKTATKSATSRVPSSMNNTSNVS